MGKKGNDYVFCWVLYRILEINLQHHVKREMKEKKKTQKQKSAAEGAVGGVNKNSLKAIKEFVSFSKD